MGHWRGARRKADLHRHLYRRGCLCCDQEQRRRFRRCQDADALSACRMGHDAQRSRLSAVRRRCPTCADGLSLWTEIHRGGIENHRPRQSRGAGALPAAQGNGQRESPRHHLDIQEQQDSSESMGGQTRGHRNGAGRHHRQHEICRGQSADFAPHRPGRERFA